MSLWFYVWITTSIIWLIYLLHGAIKNLLYEKRLSIKERKDLISLRGKYDDVIVFGQWLFFTLFFGYILMIFS